MKHILKRSTSPQEIVERAARAAGNTTKPDRGTKHFIALVLAVILAGSTMVGFAWAERQYDYPTIFDSWENAYGVFDCQSQDWLAPFDSLNNPNGIRSRNDGVIYIEPNDDSVTGSGAQLGVFLSNVGVELTDDTLTLPDGTVLSEQGLSCGGEDVELSISRWDPAVSLETPVEIRTEDLAATRFLADQQAFVLALAPAGTTISTPLSIEHLSISTNESGS